jgi:copper chaperone CopZ
LQCGGCIKKVQPHLDTIEGLYTWKVNLNSAKKTLKADVDPEEVEKVKNDIIEALNKEQYTAEPMK